VKNARPLEGRGERFDRVDDSIADDWAIVLEILRGNGN
jgi:hypothetical protein